MHNYIVLILFPQFILKIESTKIAEDKLLFCGNAAEISNVITYADIYGYPNTENTLVRRIDLEINVCNEDWSKEIVISIKNKQFVKKFMNVIQIFQNFVVVLFYLILNKVILL